MGLFTEAQMTETETLIQNYADIRKRLMGTPLPMIRRPKRVALPVEVIKIPAPIQQQADDLSDPLDLSAKTVNLRWKNIVREVCEKTGVSMIDIRSHRRSPKSLIAARREAMFRLRNETLLSLPQIGKLMGGFDHTTVLHSIGKHKASLIPSEAKP